MTADVAATSTTRAPARRPQWLRVTRTHLEVQVFLWAWVWAICAVGATVALVVIDRVGTVNVSVVQFVRNGPLVWFLFAVAILLATTYLQVHVGNGMTRRSFIRGGLVAAVVTSVLHAGTAAGLLLLEGVVYARQGWDHDAQPGAEYSPGLWEESVGVLLADHVLAALGASVSGLLVGIAYYRLGGWWGTLALPLTMLPILGFMFMTSWSEAIEPWGLPGWSFAAFGTVCAVAGALAFALLTRNVPITRKES